MGTAASAPNTMRTRPSRRDMSPPWTLTGVLRLPRQKGSRGSGPAAPHQEKQERDGREAEPGPRKTRAGRRRDPPSGRVHVEPLLPAPPVHGEPVAVEREHDIEQATLVDRL